MKESDALTTGIVRMRDGAEEICINPCASYAGGSGPLWARVGAEAQFTTDKTWTYVRGICRGITPDRKAIEFEVTHSPYTWGTFAAGQIITLKLEEISRYDNFFELSNADFNITPKRIYEQLRRELSAELEQRFRDEVGPELYDKIVELKNALDHAREAYTNLPRNFERGSIRNWEKAKKRLLRLIEKL